MPKRYLRVQFEYDVAANLLPRMKKANSKEEKNSLLNSLTEELKEINQELAPAIARSLLREKFPKLRVFEIEAWECFLKEIEGGGA